MKTTFEPRLDAVPTREELAGRLDDPALTILDVRTEEEFTGKRGYPCDPRQGHIPGARHVHVRGSVRRPRASRCPPTTSARASATRSEIVAYCHSGSRSALATLALRVAGYRARNYAGSWHEWSRHERAAARNAADSDGWGQTCVDGPSRRPARGLTDAALAV